MLVVVVGVVLAAVALAVVLVVVLGAAPVVALAGALLDVLVAVVLVVVLAGALLVVFAAAVVELVLPVLVVELPHAVKRIAPSSKTPIHQRRPVVLNQITNCPLHCVCGRKLAQVALSCGYRAPVLCHQIVKQSSRVGGRKG